METTKKMEVNIEEFMNLQAQIEQLENENQYLKQEKDIVIVAVPTHTAKNFVFKDLHMYVVKLMEKCHFADCEEIGELNRPDVEFENIILFTRREFEKEFHFSDMQLYVPEAEIEITGQASSAWMVLTKWLPDDTPIVYVAFTERDAEEFYDIAASADAQIINDLYIESIERMYLDMRRAFKKYRNLIEAADFMAERDRYEKHQLMNDFRNRILGLDTATQNKLNKVSTIKGEIQMKTAGAILLGLGWVFAFILLFFI